MQIYEVSMEGISDGHLFLKSLVPLKLVQRENEERIWKNIRPSSTHHSPALQFSFSKETPEEVRKKKIV